MPNEIESSKMQLDIFELKIWLFDQDLPLYKVLLGIQEYRNQARDAEIVMSVGRQFSKHLQIYMQIRNRFVLTINFFSLSIATFTPVLRTSWILVVFA